MVPADSGPSANMELEFLEKVERTILGLNKSVLIKKHVCVSVSFT